MQSTNKHINDLIIHAVNNINTGQHLNALSLLKQGRQVDPKNLKILKYYVKTLQKLNIHESAIEAANELIELKSPMGHLLSSKSLFELKKYREALNILELGLKAVQQNDKYYDLFLNQKKIVLMSLNSGICTKKSYLNFLPFEILHKIFSMLNLKTKILCLTLSKTWFQFLSKDQLLWTTIDFSIVTLKNTNKSLLITDDIVKKLTSFSSSSLKVLNLNNCRNLTNQLFQILKFNSTYNLNKFTLTNNRKIVPKYLSLMIFYLRKHLTEVNLSQTNFDDLNFFGLLKNCTNLKHINISDNHKLSDLFSKLNENDFNTIKGNIKVLSLNLSYCSNLSSNSLHNFEKIFMKLEQLNLEGNSSMNYNSLNVISNLMELKSINITGLNYEENGDIHFVSSKIQDFIVCLSKVEQFNLKFCPKFNGDCLSLVSACWNELTFLDITCNSQARISHFEDLIVGCSKLKTLLIGSCPGVSDEVVYKLVKNLKYLETLDISKNLSITDKSVKLISKLGASLKELSLSKCQNINGQSLKFLVFRKCGVSLKFLDISGLPNITNETITQLYTLSPNITLVSKL